jgi:hypothetical protein
MVLHCFDRRAYVRPAKAKPAPRGLIHGSSFPCERIFGDASIVPGYVDQGALSVRDRAPGQQRPGDLHPYLPV